MNIIWSLDPRAHFHPWVMRPVYWQGRRYDELSLVVVVTLAPTTHHLRLYHDLAAFVTQLVITSTGWPVYYNIHSLTFDIRFLFEGPKNPIIYFKLVEMSFYFNNKPPEMGRSGREEPKRWR